MAQVDSVRQYIALLLDHAIEQWERLPQVAKEIDQWDLIEQLTFIEGWPPQEQQLKQLERYAVEGAMAPEQLARYEELKRLVARNRPIIRALQQS